MIVISSAFLKNTNYLQHLIIMDTKKWLVVDAKVFYDLLADPTDRDSVKDFY